MPAGALAAGQAEPMPMTPARFDAWYAELRDPLHAYLRRIAGSMADDLFQEAWIRFLTHPPRTDDRSSVRAYVFTIASRLATDSWRRESWWVRLIRAPRSRSERDEAGVDPLDTVADDAPAPDERHATRQTVERSLAAHSPRERALLWLAHVERYDHREIAEMLGLRASSVRVLLHRARRRAAAAAEVPMESRGSKP